MATLLGPKTGTLRHNETAGEDGITRTASQTYIVEASAVSETAATILAVSGLPFWGSVFADDVRLSVKRRSPSRTAKSLIWYVAIEWSSSTKKREEDEEEDQPAIQRKPLISIDSEVIKRPFVSDAFTDQSITASNGQEFLSTPLKDAYVTVINFVRYEAAFPLARAIAYQGTVNLLPVTIGGIEHGNREVLISRITSDSGSEIDGEWVYSARYTFKIWPTAVDANSNGGWMRDFLDQGTFYLDNNDAVLHFVDDYGNPRTGNLDLDGGKLDDTSPPLFIWRHEHRLVDFSPLALV